MPSKHPGALVAKLGKPQQSLPYGHLLVEPRTTKIHQLGVDPHKQTDWSSLYLWNSLLEESDSIEKKHMFIPEQLSSVCSSWKQCWSPWTFDTHLVDLLHWTHLVHHCWNELLSKSSLCSVPQGKTESACLINYLRTAAIKQKINEDFFLFFFFFSPLNKSHPVMYKFFQ